MKFLIQLIVIAILAFVLELIFPWWSIAIAAFIGGMALKSNANFLAGFLGIALLWTIHSLIIDLNAAAPLAEKVAMIFKLNKPLLIVVTAVVGGLVGGFATMAGSALVKGRKKVSDRYYQ